MPLRQKSISVFTILVLALVQSLNVNESDDKAEIDFENQVDKAEFDSENEKDEAELDSEETNMNELDAEDDMYEDEALSVEQATKIHGGIDTDKDGLLSMEELLLFSERSQRLKAEHTIKDVFPEMDVDKDGKLSLQEIRGDSDNSVAEATDQEKAFDEEKFKAADMNGNGFLEIDEAPAMLYPDMYESTREIETRHELKGKDKDGDGELTIEEFWDWIDDSENKDEETKEFNALDKDGNGKLSLDEIRVFNSGRYKTREEMEVLFELGDTNGDKHIGLNELHQARKMIAGSDAQQLLMQWAEDGEL